MRNLFDRFELLSSMAQDLLDKGIKLLRDGYTPDDALCQDIIGVLSDLHSAYNDIRITLPEYILAEEMPEDDAAVHEYEEAWQNSAIRRQNAVQNILDEFIRVYSNEKLYMDAIMPFIDKAKGLIADLDSLACKSVDVSPYQIFLEGMKNDLDSDTELADRIEDGLGGFPHRVVKGLFDDKYHIREEEEATMASFQFSMPEVALSAEVQPPLVEHNAIQQEDNVSELIASEPVDDDPHTDELETLTPEEFAAKYMPADNAVEEAVNSVQHLQDEDDVDTNVEYIHPINPIQPSKLPSEQKLKELIQRTGNALGILVDNLVYLGLMDENRVFEKMSRMPKPFSREQCIETLALLERKGFLCTYEFEGRNILCFTELMDSCLQKASLSSLLKRLLDLKKIGKIYILGSQDMPLDKFTAHMMLVDQYTHVIDKLKEDKESFNVLKTSTLNYERHCFLMNLSRENENDLPLQLVSPDIFIEKSPEDGEGIFCCIDDLPDMTEVDDEVHFCLIPDGLFQWKGGKWVAITRAVPEYAEPDDCTIEEATDFSKEGRGNTVVGAIGAETDRVAELLNPPYVVTDETTEVAEQSERLWLDDLSEEIQTEPEMTAEEYNGLFSVEIATRLLNSAAIRNNPSDESMAALIHQLIAEGVRSHSITNMHDQLVEAIVLAKLLSSNRDYPMCRNIYFQLHAAIPLFRENVANSGAILTNVFAEETEYTPVTKLCAYIYGVLFPVHAHDHTFSALYKNAFTNFDLQFSGLDVLKPLYHKAMEGLKLVPTGFSPANLAALGDSKLRQERMKAILLSATELLKPPTVRTMIHGVPELIDLCFGSQTDLHSALEIISVNDIGMRDLVDLEYKKYCKDDDEVDNSILERLLDSQWVVAAQKYSSRRMGIKYEARKHLLNALAERLNIMREWLEETDTEATSDIEKLRAVRADLVSAIDKSISEIDTMPGEINPRIAKASLEIMRTKLANQGGSTADFSTMLRSGALVMYHGELVLNEDLNEIHFAEPWRSMLQHIACTDYDLRIVYEKILEAKPQSVLYDNYGQLEAIGRLIGADLEKYELSDEGLHGAINSADLEARYFREKLEISYVYNRISEKDRERLAMLADPETSDFQKYFYDNRAFGCWRAFLNALRAQIRDVAQYSMRDVHTQLDQAKAKLRPNETSPLLAEAERLISHEQNYAVAEDYIHRFRNGERQLPFETSDGAMSHYLNFISDEVFTGLYSYCERRKESSLSKFGIQYIDSNRPEGWTNRHFEDAHQFIQKWPAEKRSVNPQNIKDFFRFLGLNVEECVKHTHDNEVCCTLTVNKSEQNLADYRHPISMFGTQMKRQLEVVCLFGKRTAKQLVDDACKLGITSTFIVLLDATLTSRDRRQMAEYFFTQKNVGQASFLVIDRVLALYLAMQVSNERLPAMLQCTLPYTIYQPFTNGSGSTADEMFFGRVKELASIRDMAGASIVYGGRQLGKTALLERAKHLDHNPSRKEFAVMTSFKECRGEQAFLDILINACNESFDKSNFKVNPCNSIRDFATQLRRLLDNDRIATLRLLLDETDDFLDSISSSSYSEIQPLIELQRGSNRRFKFVLAGLHNVCRAKNATRNNGLFGQLGAPVCVSPLTSADARNLLVRPLRYLGFRVSNESHVDTILTNTNYYPGIIQFFGYTLVQTLASQYTHYYDAVRGNPPFELHDDQLASIMNSRDLNHNIKERLRWTLEMDDRYYMLARCVTVLYHLSSNDYSMISNGFDVDSIREVAKDMFNIHCLTSLSEKEIIALLDEMEEMGILSRPNDKENRYLLRRRSFIDVIGTSLDSLEHDIELYNKEVGNDG